MGDRVDPIHPASTGGRISDVTLLERQHPSLIREVVEVRHVAGDQVVDRPDPVATGEELADEPAADESGGAGDEDLHSSPRSSA